MLGIENLIFASPWVLSALVITPLLWWLLRVMPPAPRRIPFPAIRLLHDLEDREQTPDRTPLWLILLRLLIVLLVVLGLAQPVLNPPRSLPGQGPLLLVLDNGWESAKTWPRLRQMALGIAADAERNGRKLGLALTAPGPEGFILETPRAAAQVADRLEALAPLPWRADPAGLARHLEAVALTGPMQTLWIGSGAVSGPQPGNGTGNGVTDAVRLATLLQRLGGLAVVQPDADSLPLLLLPPDQSEGRLRVTLRRGAPGPALTRPVRLLSRDGAVLDRQPLTIPLGATEGTTRFDLPLKLRNRAAAVQVEGEQSAGAIVLLDERWQRRPVGLVSDERSGAGVPLLSELYYLERALAPYAELHKGEVLPLLQEGLAVVFMADLAPLPETVRTRLSDWMQSGGVLVRFAGPRLASDPDPLIPVRLRLGDRTLGGALSWTEPARLAPFDETSPFAGLAVSGDITVSRQVLAEPSLDLSKRTWARLADGTPLVTAEQRGEGWLVLVHTTAGVGWSNLALSGLYVDMLRRLIDISQHLEAPTSDRPLRPLRLLDGFGQLGPATATAAPIQGSRFADTVVSPTHPPGYYGDQGARRALNLSASITRVTPVSGLPPGVARRTLDGETQVDFKPWLLTAALLLFLGDLLLSLVLRGHLSRQRPAWKRTSAGPGVVVILMLALALAAAAPKTAHAADNRGADATGDDAFALLATSATYLAYVETGNPGVDATTRAGLDGLARVLTSRTAAETAGALGVDVERDELAFFPLLYWPVTPDQPALSEQGRRRINQYMKNGGTILFDTRQRRPGGSLFGAGAEAQALQRITQGLNIPPLQPVPPDHVLTKAFYLMHAFPGRFRGGDVWVETAADRDRDGVSAVIIGGNDWAGAWAVDESGRPKHPVIPGGERQRELAYRFGVNLVMYTLTGNYKADQVHVPAILERLGQ